jgi:protein arginine N-methyltransferase 3
MAPSQTRLVLSAITGERVWRERVDFWKSVYGESSPWSPTNILDFDMTTMNNVYFDEGLVEVVDAKEVVTSECIVRVGLSEKSANPRT